MSEHLTSISVLLTVSFASCAFGIFWSEQFWKLRIDYERAAGYLLGLAIGKGVRVSPQVLQELRHQEIEAFLQDIIDSQPSGNEAQSAAPRSDEMRN